MELLAIIKGLEQIEEPSIVVIHTDSVHVIVGARKQRTYDNALWSIFRKHQAKHQIRIVKVGKGNPHPNHNKAHHLAREAVLAC